ncbi:hypothetical protein BDV96DRAFT_652068 [Lophiotrema nucula]|uniref:Ankyrin repeat-containing domain protein n=1 Tax=Lophiotrema nucula TaxID=690887 RepID=A0A6A5YR60_9PLEO|nr:hypothetical protein BDV96DRAFT_652068 [Lophiotrema nucula]
MRLLDIPSELFAIIIRHYVHIAGTEAYVTRAVSRAFNNCLLRELYDWHPVDRCGVNKGCVVKCDLGTFLNYRIKKQNDGTQNLIGYINSIIDHLIRLFPPSEDIDATKECYQRDIIQWIVRGGHLSSGYAKDVKQFNWYERTRSINIDNNDAVIDAVAAAAAVGNLDAFQHFWVKSQVSSPWLRDNAPPSAAVASIATGKISVMRFVLKATNTEVMEKYLYGCITSAIRCRQLNILNMLLDHTESHAVELLTNLSTMVKGSSPFVARYWYLRLGKVEVAKNPGEHWLITAAAAGDIEIFQRISSVIAHRCSPGILAPVYAEACERGHVPLFQHLCSNGLLVSGNRKLRKRATTMRLLYTAASSGGRSVLAILLKFAKNKQVGNPTLVAVEKHNLIMLRYLCEHGVPVSYEAVDRAERSARKLISKGRSLFRTEELSVYRYVFQQAALQFPNSEIVSPSGFQGSKRKIINFPYRGGLEVINLLTLTEAMGGMDADSA